MRFRAPIHKAKPTVQTIIKAMEELQALCAQAGTPLLVVVKDLQKEEMPSRCLLRHTEDAAYLASAALAASLRFVREEDRDAYMQVVKEHTAKVVQGWKNHVVPWDYKDPSEEEGDPE